MTGQISEQRRLALREAVEFVTSGRMAVNVGISTVTEAAEAFHKFLDTDNEKATEAAKARWEEGNQELETPSGRSSEPASTPQPSPKKTTAPAQPDNPVDF